MDSLFLLLTLSTECETYLLPYSVMDLYERATFFNMLLFFVQDEKTSYDICC